MRALALDIGDATIGLAVSDELGITANGRPTIRRHGDDRDLDELGRVVRETGATVLVVGVPFNMDGTESEQTRKTRAFVARLSAFGLPIEEVDERWTTMAAERALREGDVSRAKRKRLVDQVAAVLILQTYLALRSRGA
jgi:putative Holliday junction resolvase